MNTIHLSQLSHPRIFFGVLLIVLTLGSMPLKAEEAVEAQDNRVEAIDIDKGSFLVLEGEVLDVELSREVEGNAVVTVQDAMTAEKLQLLVDSVRTTIQMDNEIQTIDNVMGGAKGIMIYKREADEKLPILVYLKVTSHY